MAANLIPIDIQGKDNASRAFQTATARLKELREQITALKGQELTVANARTINALTREAKTLENALKNMGSTAASAGDQATNAFGKLRDVLGGIGISLPALGAAGIAALGAAAVKTTLALGQIGESVKRSETYFRTFSGSAQAAAANLAAVQAATEGSLTKQESMQAATKLLSMGLATNAAELEKVARMAVLLGGDTRTASQSIEEFSLLLANQSIQRLDTFGISGAKVRARIEELQAATAGLSREAAFMTAVMEIGGGKVAALEAAGVSAGTGMDKAKIATKELQAELAKLIEKPYTVVIETYTRAAQGITEGIQEAPMRQREFQLTAARMQTAAYQQLEPLTLALADAERRLGEAMMFGNAAMVQREEANVAALRAELAALQATIELSDASTILAEVRLRVAQGAYDAADGERGYVGAVSAAAAAAWQQAKALQAEKDAALAAATGVGEINAALNELQNKERAAKVNAVAMAILKGEIQQATVEMFGLNAAYALLEQRGDLEGPISDMERFATAIENAQKAAEQNKFTSLAQAVVSGDMSRYTIDVMGFDAAFALLQEKRETKEKTTNKTVASDYQRQMEAAGKRMASTVEGYLGKAQSNAAGLYKMPGTGDDIFAPGANGPFEKLYQALDVAKHGGGSEWAEKLGLTQEDAARISADFQRGIFSEDVIGLIDVNALINEAKMAALAEQSKKAFADEIAKQAGVGTNLVSAMFGFESTGGGAKDAQTRADAAMKQVADSIGVSVKGADFAGQMIGFGETVFTHFETGIAKKAKGSTALTAAIVAMVENALMAELQ